MQKRVKKQKGFFFYRNETYDFPLVICFNKSTEQINKYVSQFHATQKAEHIDAQAATYLFSWGALVNFNRRAVLTSPDFANDAAHEATHVTNYIFSEINQPLDTENDEPQAYLCGWVVEKIWQSAKALKK